MRVGESEDSPSTVIRRPGRLSLARRSPAWPASVSATVRIVVSSLPFVKDFSLELRRIVARRSRTACREC